jgi:hypothetical protein
MSALHRRILSGVAALALSQAQAFASCCSPEGPEEFVGPFANWLNVQTTCGATGNGSTDDTAAIQSCINDLSGSTPVLYFPAPTAGTHCYKINSALAFNAQLNAQLIGADPSTTSICAGTASMTMLGINGSVYSTINRLTFKGESTASIIVDQAWDGTTGNFDTETRYTDDVFENAGYGLKCGELGQGCAETEMIRDTFTGLTTAGVALGNFNALDMWIWYSSFTGNYDGVQNTLGAGNFHVYNSKFSGDTDADLSISNTGGFNFRWNYSSGSALFFKSTSSGAGCSVNFQSNTILDYTGSYAIVGDCYGPFTMIDNVIRSPANETAGPVVLLQSGLAGASIFTMGNTFTPVDYLYLGTPEASYINFGNGNGGEWISLLDTVVPRSAVNPSAPTLPSTPPNNSRVITEETTARSSSQIQADINAAAGSGNVRPVIHLQAGAYTNMCLTIPANTDLQLIGDGWYTILTGTGSCNTLTLSGPSFATLRDFYVYGNGQNGIYVSGIDQVGARVFMDGVLLDNNTQNMTVNRLANAVVEAHQFLEAVATTTSITLTGPAGQSNGAALNIFNGAAYGNPISYAVSQGGQLAVEDSWFDNGAPGGAERLSATGSGAITFYGGNESMTAANGLPAFGFRNYTGTAALVGMGITGNVLFSGGSATDLELGNIFFGGSLSVAHTNDSGQYGVLETQNASTSYFPDSINYKSQSFIISALNQLRTTLPSIPGSPVLPSGASDLRMYRVGVQGSSVGITINP